MITWLRYDWKEQPTFEEINKALAPHNLIVKSFENGDQYEFAICTPKTTNDEIIDSIIKNFDGNDETSEELRKQLLSLIKEVDHDVQVAECSICHETQDLQSYLLCKHHAAQL